MVVGGSFWGVGWVRGVVVGGGMEWSLLLFLLRRVVFRGWEVVAGVVDGVLGREIFGGRAW